MSLVENAPKEKATMDEYVPSAQPVAPESVTLETMNEQNKKYWKHAGGETDDE